MLVDALGLGQLRHQLVVRAAAWMARQRARIAGAERWQDGWPRTGWGLLVDAGLTEAGDDPRGWATPPTADVGCDVGDHLRGLVDRLRLAPAVGELLAGLVVASLDVELARVWHALSPVPAAPAYTFGAWVEILGGTRPRERALLAVAHRDHPLRRLRLIQLEDGPPWAAPIGLTAEALVGLTTGVASLAPIEPATDVVLEDGELARLAALATMLPRRLLIAGRAGSGRRTRASLIARRAGRPAVAVTAREPVSLAEALRDAVIVDALPVLEVPAEPPSEAWWHQVARFEGELILIGEPAAIGELHRRVPGLSDLAVGAMPASAQRQLWRQRLVRDAHPVDAGVLDTLVAAYDLPPGDIEHLAARVRHDAAAGAITVTDVQRALRASTTTELWGLAQPYRTIHTWDDVILPEATRTLLRELIAHIRHRATVFETWGFDRKVAYGRSLSALFYGPPGTGKTMVAGIIANDFGRELYRVDLSRVVDKYVGETEKNLRRVFDEARKTQALLLFDEADALFAKRTKVDSSNDRYANLAVNFLLQEMEQFDGCCLLTTNLDSTLDEAFRRRLRFRIEFPRPTDDERTRLWPSMIPAGAPVAPDVDWRELADTFDRMTGAHIKNAVVRAAFLAAAEGSPITQALLRQAARAEYEETGHVSGRS